MDWNPNSVYSTENEMEKAAKKRKAKDSKRRAESPLVKQNATSIQNKV